MNKKYYVLLGVILVVIAIVIGTSYAFFMVNVTGGDSGNETVIKSGSLNLTLADTNTITLNNSKPGDSASKEFTVTNTSKSSMIYNIKLVDVTNTFVDKNDLVYSIVGDNGVNITDNVVPSVSDEYLVTNISIDRGATHTYTLTITFKETNDNQNDNMRVGFSGRINIDDEEIFIPVTPVELLNNLYSDSNTDIAIDDYDNIRYIGADPANYIYFNCDDYSNPSDSTCEKWRIIGSFKDIEDSEGQIAERVKIMRDESIGNMPWDESDSTHPYGSNNWADSTLNNYLNGDYYNALTDDTKNMISNINWNIGGSKTYNDVTAKMFYERERGSEVYGDFPATWTGKIALIYASDYGYATSGGSTTNREACLNKELYNWDSVSDCYINNYLYSYRWTLSYYSSYYYVSFYIGDPGFLRSSSTHYGCMVNPTLYLNSKIKITSGDGSSESPYVLGV